MAKSESSLLPFIGIAAIVFYCWHKAQPTEQELAPVEMPPEQSDESSDDVAGMGGLGAVASWRNFGQCIVEINPYRRVGFNQYQHVGDLSRLNNLLRPPRRVNGYASESNSFGGTFVLQNTPSAVGYVTIRGSVYTNSSNVQGAALSELRNALYLAGYNVRRSWFAPANARLYFTGANGSYSGYS